MAEIPQSELVREAETSEVNRTIDWIGHYPEAIGHTVRCMEQLGSYWRGSGCGAYEISGRILHCQGAVLKAFEELYQVEGYWEVRAALADGDHPDGLDSDTRTWMDTMDYVDESMHPRPHMGPRPEVYAEHLKKDYSKRPPKTRIIGLVIGIAHAASKVGWKGHAENPRFDELVSEIQTSVNASDQEAREALRLVATVFTRDPKDFVCSQRRDCPRAQYWPPNPDTVERDWLKYD